MDLQLIGKRALVTGSTRGLGFATARMLSHEGCLVAINGRDDTRIQTAVLKISNETRKPVYGIAGDVSDPAVPEKLVAEAVETLGGLDLLVCNAGGPPPGAFESFDETTWQKAINLSFMSHVRLIKAALPHLRNSGAASVLTFTSYTVRQPLVNLVLSNSVRLATIGLTKSLALELGKDGIRFNSILPAWTETERVTELLAARAKTNGTTLEEELSKQAKESAFGRMATSEEFASVAVFLLSPVSSYITGAMIPVDGGMIKGTM